VDIEETVDGGPKVACEWVKYALIEHRENRSFCVSGGFKGSGSLANDGEIAQPLAGSKSADRGR
jgi:hypothetical protein